MAENVNIERGQRVRELRERMQLSQAALGRMVGKASGTQAVSSQAVGYWESGRGITLQNLRALAAIFGVSMHFIDTGEDDDELLMPADPGDPVEGATLPSRVGFQTPAAIGGAAPVVGVPVAGRIAADSWRARDPLNFEGKRQMIFSVEVPNGTDGLFALIASDSSANRLSPEGSFVICRPVQPGESVPVGRRVAVLRTDPMGRRELSVRRLLRIDHKFLLMLDTIDPAWAEIPAIVYDPEDRSVEIVGLVISSVIPE